MPTKYRPLICLLSLLVLLLPKSKAADLSGDYEWSPMKIGGGGWVVGLSVNPAEKDLFYARADVSGAYRWNVATNFWKHGFEPAGGVQVYVCFISAGFAYGRPKTSVK